MIIIGYPGIGKTSLAAKNFEVIDLESSHFHGAFDSRRDRPTDGWWKPYVKVALDLHLQGYTVCVSSHEDVMHELSKLKEKDIVICYPSLELKTEWIEKLHKRYIDSFEDEDSKYFAAYFRARSYYEQDIDRMKNAGFRRIEIQDMEYDLVKLIYDGENNEEA